MRQVVTFLLVLGLLSVADKQPPAAGQDKAREKEKKRAPKFTVSKETTYVTGPRTPEGYIDYASALNKRLSQGVTPANNANVLLWRAFGPHPEGATMPAEFFEWMGIEAPPEHGAYFVDLFRYMKERLGIVVGNEFLEQMEGAAERPWTAKQFPHLATWLKANEKPLALVVEATKRPHYFSPLVPTKAKNESSCLIGALLPAVQQCRGLTNALATRAMLHLAQGHHDEAWQDLLACHRLGRLVARGSTLIEGLVGIAIDAIASNANVVFLDRAKLTPKQLKDCLRELQQLPRMPAVADKVDLGERFMFLDIVMMVDRGGVRTLDGLVVGVPAKALHPLAQRLLEDVDWDPALRSANRWYDRLSAAMRLPDRAAREKQLDQIEQELKALKVKLLDSGELAQALGGGKNGKVKGKILGDVLISLLVPAVRKVQHAGDRTEQIQRNLHLAFALAAYHREHGRYPLTLDALAPKYVATIPQDLFAAKALLYRPSRTGYLLYSVGVNGRDEQGRYYHDDPPGDDLRVRMPLPAPERK